MDAAARFSALIDEFQALDTSSEPERARSLVAQATQLVDREAQPKKWAALRGLYADLCGDHADEAIAAYRDALTMWQREDGIPFSHCHARLGELLLDRALALGENTEAALEHLDAALPGDPTIARKAAYLWAVRKLGDPYENWTRRRAALDVAVGGIDRHAEPVAWARAMNELALALGEEPGADFRNAVESRLARHHEALAALVDRRSALALEIRLQLSECHAMRVIGIGEANRAEAATLARDVLSDCDATTPTTIMWRALLATIVALDTPRHTPASRGEMASLLERAAALAPAGSLDEATIHSFHVNLALARVDDGEHEAIPALVAHAQAALRILDPARDATTRASIGQRLGEGHVAVGDYVSAQAALDVALADRERGLARATSLPGRREALFALGETAALAAWCAIRRGEAFEAVALLERGRSRLWRREAPALTESTLAACVPAGGAVLLPVFASDGGAVVMVVHEAAGVRCETVALPHFGRDEMMALQRGRDPGALGGWLLAYAKCIDDPDGWQQTIARTCDTLRRMIWLPVLAKLRALGVADDAELVWLPQGGSAVFPFHAAVAYAADGDTATAHSIRYAPSLHAIATTRTGEVGGRGARGQSNRRSARRRARIRVDSPRHAAHPMARAARERGHRDGRARHARHCDSLQLGRTRNSTSTTRSLRGCCSRTAARSRSRSGCRYWPGMRRPASSSRRARRRWPVSPRCRTRPSAFQRRWSSMAFAASWPRCGRSRTWRPRSSWRATTRRSRSQTCRTPRPCAARSTRCARSTCER